MAVMLVSSLRGRRPLRPGPSCRSLRVFVFIIKHN